MQVILAIIVTNEPCIMLQEIQLSSTFQFHQMSTGGVKTVVIFFSRHWIIFTPMSANMLMRLYERFLT
jgi:hypothetical protein